MRIAAGVSRLYWRAKGVSSSPWIWSRQRYRALRLQESSVPSEPLKIRVGFLSRFLMRSHSLGQHIRGVMQHLDRSPIIAIHIKNDAESYGLDDMIGLADEDISISSAVSNLHESRILAAGTKLDVLVFRILAWRPCHTFGIFSTSTCTNCHVVLPASLGTGRSTTFSQPMD